MRLPVTQPAGAGFVGAIAMYGNRGGGLVLSATPGFFGEGVIDDFLRDLFAFRQLRDLFNQ
jgi:hypothetical protein